jgi:hypothetical protein
VIPDNENYFYKESIFTNSTTERINFKKHIKNKHNDTMTVMHICIYAYMLDHLSSPNTQTTHAVRSAFCQFSLFWGKYSKRINTTTVYRSIFDIQTTSPCYKGSVKKSINIPKDIDNSTDKILLSNIKMLEGKHSKNYH